jgi:hypothetical protein
VTAKRQTREAQLAQPGSTASLDQQKVYSETLGQPSGLTALTASPRPSSSTLLIATLFPTINTPVLVLVLAAILTVGSAAVLLVLRLTTRMRRPAQRPPAVDRSHRTTWRTPPLATLAPYAWSPSLKLAMILLRGYLILSAVLLVIKAIQLSRG